MIYLRNIFIKYGDRVLLDHINVNIGNRERISIVGNNGAGKSTLLKIIAGYLTPDSGKIEIESNPEIGYLEQEIQIGDNTVFDEASKGLGKLKQLDSGIEEVTRKLEIETDHDILLDLSHQLSELNEQYELAGGHGSDAKISKVLKGFGFKDEDFQKKLTEFSGGWQMRVVMTKLLLSEPEFLLLDEPTNYLDIESIIWLEGYISNYPGTVILISHDRRFLDKVCKRTVEIVKGKVYDYPVSYTKFVEKKKERNEMLSAAAKNQAADIAQKERTITRFMAKSSKTKMAQSMKKQLDKVERIEFEEEDSQTMRISFLEAPRLPREVVSLKNLSKAYGELKVLSNINFNLERSEKIAFVGQNGQGKSTLAKIIAGVLDFQNGEKNIGQNVEIAYYAQDETEKLDLKKSVLEEMEEYCPSEMRTKVRSILGAFLFTGEDVDKKVSVLSGGEKSRLAFAKMLLRPSNFLILDEPTNHLDMLSKDILKQALLKFENSLIIVSHDRDFLSGLTTKTIEFRDRSLYSYLGDINYFLEKRAINHLADAEKRSVVDISGGSNKKVPLSREDQKQMKRKIQYLERDIEKLENEIAKIEVQIANPDFYSSSDSKSTLDSYSKLKSNLKSKIQEWENLVESSEF
jgi:ATP-binding cassette subfamily F protein 3